MRQEQVILDAVQNPIDDIEEYPDARQVESVKGIKDHIGAVVAPIDKNWHFANEPNDTTRLWCWFREGWRIKDHSCHGNDVFASQLEPAPYPVDNYVPLRRRNRDAGGVTEGRLYGILDGRSQYYRIKDGPQNRITDLLSTNNEFAFSVFFSPYQTYILDEDDCATVYQKLDDDQSNNAVRVCVNEAGTVMFYLNYKGESYTLETAPGVVPFLETPEFIPGQFLSEEFMTTSTKPWQWNPDVTPPDWTWLFFSFNKTTRQLKISKVADGGFTATQIAASTAKPEDETILANVKMWLPANEASAEALGAYDIVDSHHAMFTDANPANQPDYTTDGFLHFEGNNQVATIPNHADLNTLSTFTMAFKIRLHSYAVGAVHDMVFGKDTTSGAINGNGGLMFYMGHSANTQAMTVDFVDNAGNYRFLSCAAAITALNTWYNVIWTYDGTTFRLEAGAVTATPITASSAVFTNSNNYKIGSPTHSFQGDIADVVIVKGEAWDATKKTQYKAMTPGYRSTVFPAWKPPKPPVPETPLPVVRPVEKVYEKILTDGTADTVKLNAPALTTPFVSEYNVPGGTPSTIPEELKYDVADGTTGGSSTTPVTTIYNLAAASSTGNIASSERAYVQRIDSNLSSMFGKNPTDMQFWVDRDSSADGQVYVGIIRNDGTYTKFGTGVAASSLSSGTWTSIAGQSFVARTNLAIGDGVGVIREGHSSGTIKVRRGGTGNHYDKHSSGSPVYSWQHIRTLSAWGSDNPDFSIAGVVKDGGITTAGSNPYAAMTSVNQRFYHWQQNSTLENIIPTKVIFRVRRLGSAASATVICRIRDTANNVLYTYPQTISFNTIGTTVQDIQFDDVNQTTVQLADGYRIGIEYGNATGINTTTVYLEVNYNAGTGSGAFGGTAWKPQYYRVTAPIGWNDYPNADWAGKIYIGGSSFTSYVEFEPTLKSIAEKVNSSTAPASKLFGDKHSKITATLKKVNSPTGPITAKIWDDVGNEKAVFNTVIDASSLSTSDAVYVFTFPLNNYVTALNDKIGLQYSPANTTDKVLIKINTDAAAGAAGDGTKSILSTFRTGVGWQDQPTLDLAVEIFSGGVPDTNSKPKAAIRCDSIFSRISQKKITRAVIPVRKFGAPTGTYYIRSVRGSDGANRDLLGSGDISTLSTSTYLYKDVSNYTATHFIGESDKIVVEFEGGDPSNGLQVQVDKASTYDDEDTRFEAFDGVNWNKDEFATWDMAATLYTGGDTYIPDAGTPYVEPPDFYDHDGLIGGGAFVKNAFTSFYGMRIRDFRIETSIPTLEQMDNLFNNKYSRRGGAGEIALIGYSTFNSETEAPP